MPTYILFEIRQTAALARRMAARAFYAAEDRRAAESGAAVAAALKRGETAARDAVDYACAAARSFIAYVSPDGGPAFMGPTEDEVAEDVADALRDAENEAERWIGTGARISVGQMLAKLRAVLATDGGLE